MLDRSPVEWRTTKSRFNEGDFQGPGGSGKGLEGKRDGCYVTIPHLLSAKGIVDIV